MDILFFYFAVNCAAGYFPGLWRLFSDHLFLINLFISSPQQEQELNEGGVRGVTNVGEVGNIEHPLLVPSPGFPSTFPIHSQQFRLSYYSICSITVVIFFMDTLYKILICPQSVTWQTSSRLRTDSQGWAVWDVSRKHQRRTDGG